MTAVTTALNVPSTAALLDAWEDAQTSDPRDRALQVLESMCVRLDGDLDERSPGELNRLLLRARMLLFGDTCDTVAQCPACGAQLEATLSIATLLSGECAVDPVGERTLDGLRVSYRTPTWRELRALADRPIDDAAAELLALCVTEVRSGRRKVAYADLDASFRQAIDDAVGQADPDALIEIALACQECGETARLPMDPASFLWNELDRWALSTLYEVAELAAVYGWSERSILSMTPWRRRAYLSIAAPAEVLP